MKTVLSPFIYVYKGFLVVLKSIFSFIKYVFLGIIAFPSMIAKLFTKDKKSKTTMEAKKNDEIYKKTDVLLAQQEKQKALKKRQEEAARQKMQNTQEKKVQKRLNDYISDLTEEQRKELEQNKQTFEKYKQLYLQRKKRITIFKKKLLRGNPHATSKHYNTELNELKQYLELQSQKKKKQKPKKKH